MLRLEFDPAIGAFGHRDPPNGTWRIFPISNAKRPDLRKFSDDNWERLWGREDVLLASGSVCIRPSGFVRISVDGPRNDQAGSRWYSHEYVAAQFFYALKTVFHRHRFHSERNDSILRVYRRQAPGSSLYDVPALSEFERLRSRLARAITSRMPSERSHTAEQVEAAKGILSYYEALFSAARREIAEETARHRARLISYSTVRRRSVKASTSPRSDNDGWSDYWQASISSLRAGVAALFEKHQSLSTARTTFLLAAVAVLAIIVQVAAIYGPGSIFFDETKGLGTEAAWALCKILDRGGDPRCFSVAIFVQWTGAALVAIDLLAFCVQRKVYKRGEPVGGLSYPVINNVVASITHEAVRFYNLLREKRALP